MSSSDLLKSGLPSAFSSTKVTKRTERNRKKKAQKRSKRNGKKDASTKGDNDFDDQQYNYAEEFKVNEVLSEYKKEFTILMPKADRFKVEEECEEEDYYEQYDEAIEQEAECDEYEESIELDYEFDGTTANTDIVADTAGTDIVTDTADTVVTNKADTTVATDSSTTADTDLITTNPTNSTSVKKHLQKYYHQRYDYFSLFDSGIQIDDEGWYSVTPESIAHHIAVEAHSIALTNKNSAADSSDYTVIVDVCCGVGGNTIQFAMLFDKVIAIDLDAGRLEMARHNASIYGVADRIEFIHGDLFDVLNRTSEMSPDLVFLSPPWGGPDYINQSVFCPRAHLLDNRGQELFNLARKVSKNLILFLPRQSNIYTVAEMLRDEKDEVSDSESFVVEQHWLKNRLKAISIYFY